MRTLESSNYPHFPSRQKSVVVLESDHDTHVIFQSKRSFCTFKKKKRNLENYTIPAKIVPNLHFPSVAFVQQKKLASPDFRHVFYGDRSNIIVHTICPLRAPLMLRAQPFCEKLSQFCCVQVVLCLLWFLLLSQSFQWPQKRHSMRQKEKLVFFFLSHTVLALEP